MLNLATTRSTGAATTHSLVTMSCHPDSMSSVASTVVQA